MKDNFSAHADEYAKYRPSYPTALFHYINGLVISKEHAWDCGTGNGQVAEQLAKEFNNVYATDISFEQLKNAIKVANVHYSVQPAEQTTFPNRLFDLIVVAQAIHWFNFEKFYAEVRRTGKKQGLICVIGYGRIQISNAIDTHIDDFEKNIIGSYWDPERRFIDEHYQTIPFPFEEIETPEFVNRLNWTLPQLVGYLNTWSAVKHFIKAHGTNPVDDLAIKLTGDWGHSIDKEVKFPLLLRVGRI